MIGFSILAILGTFLGMSVHFLVGARRGLAEALRVQKIVSETTTTRVADAPTAGRIHITGRATGLGGEVVRAPFTGVDALWAHVSVRSNIGQISEEWTVAVDELEIDDGSGRLARVRLEGATVRVPDVSVQGEGHDARIAAYLREQGRASDDGESSGFAYQATLVPGQVLSVIGAAQPREGAYRESGAALSISADAGELLLFDPASERARLEAERGMAGCSTFGIVVLTVAMIVTALLAYGH